MPIATSPNRGIHVSLAGSPIRGLLTFQDPKQFLFFTRTPNGRQAGQEFLARLKERAQNREKAISLRSYAAQLTAIHRWGLEQSSDLSVIHQPVLVANGESDKIVPTKNSADLARCLPDSELVTYPDAGDGGIFQFHAHNSSGKLSNSSDGVVASPQFRSGGRRKSPAGTRPARRGSRPAGTDARLGVGPPAGPVSGTSGTPRISR